jgi:hypothetical protein
MNRNGKSQAFAELIRHTVNPDGRLNYLLVLPEITRIKDQQFPVLRDETVHLADSSQDKQGLSCFGKPGGPPGAFN